MKKKVIIASLLIAFASIGYAQENVRYINSNLAKGALNGMNISFGGGRTIPATYPSATADWFKAMPPDMITAQTQLINGQVPGDVQECRILVTIKQGGSKKYGSFTQDNAPSAGITTAVKTWSGSDIAGLLGKDVVLPPGSYELCVQFFSNKTPAKPISNEVYKIFTVAGSKDEKYTPPVNQTPADKQVFTDKDAKGILTFRWIPVLPPIRQNIYKLKVWQLMQGQNGTQAMKTNKPVMERDVRDATQAAITGLYTGPCKPPYMCAFIWQVEVVNEQGKVLAVSEATEFKIDIQKELPKEAAKELQKGEFKN